MQRLRGVQSSDPRRGRSDDRACARGARVEFAFSDPCPGFDPLAGSVGRVCRRHSQAHDGRLLRSRSAGIKDLRWGALCDEDWIGRDPDALGDAGVREISLLDGVTYHFVSASVTFDPEHPLGNCR
ncbi:MAG TPA: hypothetical protein ENK31_09875 [Nannocystis exedens]|nr:hypothetical protein [Nannocystis exedens]